MAVKRIATALEQAERAGQEAALLGLSGETGKTGGMD
jgi:hypothetical protein